MPKVVGIIGYKNSGKTTLTRALARELVSRGHEVAVIKHSSHRLNPPGKDTAMLGEVVGQDDCVSLQPATEVKIDRRSPPMNPFISAIVRSTILGMLSPLKGFKKGKIEISI